MNANETSPDRLPAMRDERGRLMPRSRIGVGNSGQRHRGELGCSLINAETPENIRKIGDKQISVALDGDVAAGKLHFEHLIGKPRISVDDSDSDSEQISHIKAIGAIMAVLGDDPEVRIKVGMALRQLELSEFSI
jgi:hypothetical protein